MKCDRQGCEGELRKVWHKHHLYYCEVCFKAFTWYEYRKLWKEREIEFVRK